MMIYNLRRAAIYLPLSLVLAINIYISTQVLAFLYIGPPSPELSEYYRQNISSTSARNAIHASNSKDDALSTSSVKRSEFYSVNESSFLSEDLDTNFIRHEISDFVQPVFYTLRILADPCSKRFSGQSMISVNITSMPSQDGIRFISLHASADIMIRKAFFIQSDNLQINASTLGRDIENEIITIDFQPNFITDSSGHLLIVYNGKINMETHGLFRTYNSASSTAQRSAPKYTRDNICRYSNFGLATHFQPNGARHVFPCWDKPHLKAKFRIHLVIPVDRYTAMSNMPIKNKYHSLSAFTGEPIQEIVFHTTPPMSTYLVALVVGRYDCIEDITSSQCNVRAYVQESRQDWTSDGTCQQLVPQSIALGIDNRGPVTAPVETVQHSTLITDTSDKKINHARFALTIAVRALDFYEGLFALRYPLPKLDLIAISSFESAAMENWGANIFNEGYMLSDDLTPTKNKQWIALAVAHEIAHQWFGNLVTPKSWSYLWLNEGFAEFMMFNCIDALHPEYNIWHLFLTDVMRPAMEADMSHYIHPLETTVSDTRSILAIFDQISYYKGASLMRMLHYHIGDNRFESSIRHYLTKYSYNNTVSDDLWDSFQLPYNQTVDDNIHLIMFSWTKISGYPLLKLKISTQSQQLSREGKQSIIKQEVRIEQEKFGYTGDTVQTSEPIFYDIGTNVSRNTNILPLNQQDYHSNSNNDTKNSKNIGPMWIVPITLLAKIYRTDKVRKFLLSGRNKTIQITSNATSDNTLRTSRGSHGKSYNGWWIKLNYNSIGYYRVDYPNSNWLALGDAVRHQELQTIDRMNLQDDLFALVRYGKRRIVDYLEYLRRYYLNEEEYIVWSSIFDSLRVIRLLVSAYDPDNYHYQKGNPESTTNLQLLNRYMQSFLRETKIYQTILSSSDTELDFWLVHHSRSSHISMRNDTLDHRQQLKVQLVKHLIQFDDEELKYRASQFFHQQIIQQWGGETRQVDVNLKSSIYRATLMDSENETLHRWFWDRYQSADTNSNEKSSISSALALTKNSTRQQEMLINRNLFRHQGLQPVIQSMATSRMGRQLLFQYLISNHKQIRDEGLFNIWLKSLAFSPEYYQELAQFFKTPNQSDHSSSTAILSQPDLSPSPPPSIDQPGPQLNEGKNLDQSIRHLDSRELHMLEQVLETIELNRRWIKRDGAQLIDYIKNRI